MHRPMIARFRKTISNVLFTAMIIGSCQAAAISIECCVPSYLVELVVNGCQWKTTSPAGSPLTEHRRGAALTALVYSQAKLPPGPEVTLGTEDVELERFEPPLTREYFFYSDDPNVCEELTAHAPVVLTQVGSGCGYWMDRRDCSILEPLPSWLLELQRSVEPD